MSKYCPSCGGRPDSCNLHTAAPGILDTLKAIKARIDGVFDAPELMAKGGLNTDKNQDIKNWIDDIILDIEGT